MRAFSSILTCIALLWSGSSAAYERVISLAPHITELIYAIGAESTLVATVESSDHPPAALELDRVGDGISLSAEQLLTFNPDLILAWQPTPTLQALEKQLAHHAIPIKYITPQSLPHIAESAWQLGVWLNHEPQALRFKQHWQQRLQELENRYAKPPYPALFVALNGKPLYSLNDPIINDVLRTCGATNWLPPSSPMAPAINVEQLLRSPADGLIYSEWDASLERLYTLLNQAYKHRTPRFQVNPDHFYRPGPRLLAATALLCAELALIKM